MKKRIFKNTVKVILTITLTIAAYKYAAIERGYFAGIVGGGETAVPILCWLLLWFFPAAIKETKGSKKWVIWEKLENLKKNLKQN